MKNYSYSMKICFVNDLSKKARVKKVFDKLFDSLRIETISREEKVEPEGYTITVYCKIRAKTIDDALVVNTRLSKKFNGEIKKIFGPNMRGLKNCSGGIPEEVYTFAKREETFK